MEFQWLLPPIRGEATLVVETSERVIVTIELSSWPNFGPQAQRNQASNHKSTMRCLLFHMWSVQFRLCQLYSSTPPSTYCWTWKLCDWYIFQQSMGIQASCLVYEMLFINQRNPCLNTQTDSICTKLFV